MGKLFENPTMKLLISTFFLLFLNGLFFQTKRIGEIKVEQTIYRTKVIEKGGFGLTNSTSILLVTNLRELVMGVVVKKI